MFERFFRSTAVKETTTEDLHKTPEEILAKGTLEQVKKLMESENRIVFNYGFSALHYAAANKDIAILTYLVEERRIINLDFPADNGTTPLHRAAFSGNIKAIDFLINKGADFNVKNKSDLTMMSILQYGEKGRNAHLIPKVKDIIAKKQSQEQEASAQYLYGQPLEVGSSSIRNRKRSDEKSNGTTEEQFLLKPREEKHPSNATCNRF